MRYFPHLIVVILAFFAVAACERKPEGPVVARVNERAITLDEFEEEVRKSLARDPEFSGSDEDREGLLDEVITRELLIQEGMRLGLDRTESFKRKVRNHYEQALIDELLRARIGEIPAEVSDEDARERYALMGKVYHTEIVAVNAPSGEGQCVRTEPEMWRSVTGGVCRNCHDMSIERGLEVMPEYFPPAFTNVLTGLGPGDVGGPVPLGEGKLCFVKVREVQTVALPPYEEIRGQIKSAIMKQKQAEALEGWIKSLREKAEVEVNREALGKAR